MPQKCQPTYFSNYKRQFLRSIQKNGLIATNLSFNPGFCAVHRAKLSKVHVFGRSKASTARRRIVWECSGHVSREDAKAKYTPDAPGRRSGTWTGSEHPEFIGRQLQPVLARFQLVLGIGAQAHFRSALALEQ